MTPARRITAVCALLIAAACGPVTATQLAPQGAAAPQIAAALWDTAQAPTVAADPDTHSVEIGTRFSASASGQVVGVRFYKGKGNTGTHTVDLWSPAGALARTYTVSGESATGWQTQLFGTPQQIGAGEIWIASYVAPRGHYADDAGYFPHANGVLSAGLNAGVYSYTGGVPNQTWNDSSYWVTPLFLADSSPSPTPTPTTSPSSSPTPTPSPTNSPTPSPTVTPSPTPTPTPGACVQSARNVPDGPDPWGGCFPGPASTGWKGATTAYTGGGTIAAGSYTGRKFTGDFVVNSGHVDITDSVIDGTIRTTGSGTLSLTDVTIDGGIPAFDSSETFIDLQGANITALRLDLSGANAGFSCTDNCSLADSWLHDPYIVGAKHYDSVGSNGVDGFKISHNSIWCNNHARASGSSGGCTADAGFFADFGPIVHVNGDHNLFVASNDSAGYCLNGGIGGTKPYAGSSGNDSWVSNVFQKGANGRCGQFGPVDYWTTNAQNVWSDNHWDDGTALNE